MIIIIIIYLYTNIYLSRCYFYIVPVFFFAFFFGNSFSVLGTFLDFIVLRPAPLHFTSLHFTSRWFARKHYPVSLHRYNCFLDHLRSLAGFYSFDILLHLLFYGPPFSSESFSYRKPYFTHYSFYQFP